MEKFNNFIKKTWWLFLLLFLAPIVVMMVLAIMEYSLHKINISAGDWAGLLGAAFGYWGTVILGILAFWQNDQIQENNNVLVNYEKSKMSPIFSLMLNGYQGMLQNLRFILLNCSDNVACSVEVSDLEIYKANVKGSTYLVSKTPRAKTNEHNVLEAHSQVEIEYKNASISKMSGDKIFMIIKITASDIIGLKSITTVTIRINDNLECQYEYCVQSKV